MPAVQRLSEIPHATTDISDLNLVGSASAEPEHPLTPVTPPKPPVTTAPPTTGDHEPKTEPPHVTPPVKPTVIVSGETQTGGTGSDSIAGRDGNDVLRGEAGNDTLSGGAGNDTLSGGRGADVLTGGAGHDTFQIAGGVTSNVADLDRITDFTHGEDSLYFGIHLKLGDGHFATGTAASYADAFKAATASIGSGAADAAAYQVGADIIVFADYTGHNHLDAGVVLVGKSLASLTASDFF